MLSPILRLLLTYLAVGLVVFGFFNRDKLADMLGWGSEDAPASAAVTPTPAAAPAPAPATAPAAPVFAPAPGDNGVPAPVAAPTPAPAPAPTPALQAPTPPAAASTAGVLQTPTPPATPPATAAAPQPATTLQSPTAPTLAAPAAQAQADDSFDSQIGRARAAYWQGDLASAIAIYGDLLKEYPESEQLHGELGNIYYMNGNRVEAATQYEAAGMAALKEGRRQQAQMLLGVLGTLDRAAATRLQKAMEGSQ